MSTYDCLNAYYGRYDEEGRLLSRHGQVEFLTTMHYIDRYLAQGDSVLEIGAGTGRYSHALARRGFAVEAVELVPHNVERFRRNTSPGERVNVRQGDALDLSCFPDGGFDVTLLLGPMYHLFTFEDKRLALSEALRVTWSGGILFVAYCLADASILQYGFFGGHIRELLEKRLLDPDTFAVRSTPAELFELHRKQDIEALNAGLPADRLRFAASDCLTRYAAAAVDAMDDDTFALYVKYCLSVCERPDLVGAANHALDILRKR